jgi:hypothetical protein
MPTRTRAPERRLGLRAAIFDFELIDTSLEGAMNGPRPDETARLVRLGDQLRTLVTSSGKLEVIDIAPMRAEAHSRKSSAPSFRSLAPCRLVAPVTTWSCR